jgi:hypothetical protein
MRLPRRVTNLQHKTEVSLVFAPSALGGIAHLLENVSSRRTQNALQVKIVSGTGMSVPPRPPQYVRPTREMMILAVVTSAQPGIGLAKYDVTAAQRQHILSVMRVSASEMLPKPKWCSRLRQLIPDVLNVLALRTF